MNTKYPQEEKVLDELSKDNPIKCLPSPNDMLRKISFPSKPSLPNESQKPQISNQYSASAGPIKPTDNLADIKALERQLIQRQKESARAAIVKFCDMTFQKHDWNHSGYLDQREIFPAVSELLTKSGLPPPTYDTVLAIMDKFDYDRNGLIDIEEFRRLLFKLYDM